VKRGTDWSDISELDLRDEAAQGPLDIEPLAPQDRHRPVGWRTVAGLLVAVTLVALAGRALDSYEAAGRVPLASPTPIPWVNAIVPPASAAESGPAALGPVPSVTAEVIMHHLFWTAGQPNHFTVQVTNTTSQAIPLTPCPTYAMYVLGTPANLATVRTINCDALNSTFGAGESISLDMVYTPSATDPIGFQSIEWNALSGFQATAQVKSIDIGD